MSTEDGEGPWTKLIVAIVVLVIAAFCYMKVYSWEEDSCKERGGHLEHVVGGRGSVCIGAER